jgi:cytochrome P450
VHDRFARFVAAQTRQLIAELPPERAELRRGLAGPLSVAVVASALGLSAEGLSGEGLSGEGLSTVDAPTVLRWYDAIVSAVSGVSAGHAIPPEATTAFAQLHAGVAASIARRDETSLVGTAELAVDEVVSNAAVLMFGGIETTEGMICNLAVHVLTRPDVLAALRADRTLIPAAVEESLRLEPAAAVVDRYATRDVELGGASIRAGDLVTASITGANRDPAVFADPDRFDLGRANVRQQLAFARGPHVCIGLDLARLEAATALDALLDLPELRLTADAAPRGLVFRKPPAVHVTWHL